MVVRIAIIAFFVLNTNVFANEGARTWVAELELSSLTVHGDKGTPLAQEVFVESPATAHGTGATLNGYHDDWLWSGYIGIVQHFWDDELKIGFAAGVAHYNTETHVSWNPWFKFENDAFVIKNEFDFFQGDIDDTYYRLEVFHKASRGTRVGFETEEAIGFSPAVQVKLVPNITVEAMVPLFWRPKPEDRVDFLGRLQMSWY